MLEGVFKIDISNAIISKDVLESVVNNINYNKTIIGYYKRFSFGGGSIAFGSDMLLRKKNAMEYCNMFWRFDKYEHSKVKDFKKTNLCHDKFCANCKKVRQSSRMSKYIPELNNYKDSLFHCIFTLPNVQGSDLLLTVKHMSKCFKQLINYLTCHDKILGLNFSSWNYEGAVRSLEITFNEKTYHPHYHVAFSFDNNFLTRKNIENTFSFNYKKNIPELVRLFSKEEILLQKIWYLLINKKKVTLQNIDNLDVGYSCCINKFCDDDYVEVFKYMTKERDEKGNILTYQNFIDLYFGTYRMKQIQGYGCFYKINDTGDLDSLEQKYEEYIKELKNIESPVDCLEKPQKILEDNKYTYISRKSYFKYLNTL